MWKAMAFIIVVALIAATIICLAGGQVQIGAVTGAASFTFLASMR